MYLCMVQKRNILICEKKSSDKIYETKIFAPIIHAEVNNTERKESKHVKNPVIPSL